MGSLIQICIADAAIAPMQSVREIECLSGRGLAGDRYFVGTGTFSATAKKPSHEVTLVAAEEIEDFNARFGTNLKPEDLRRNLVTRGIRLNELVGQRFTIGPVTFEGIRLCEPCSHLAAATREEVLTGLVHHAGLRAAIVESGMVRVGDPVLALVIGDSVARLTSNT
jgi:MOSC domain-containing protein YiiM